MLIDDCISIKSGRGMEAFTLLQTSEEIGITNCTMADSIFAWIGIGSETWGGIRNLRIEHCKFTGARTFALYIVGSAEDHATRVGPHHRRKALAHRSSVSWPDSVFCCESRRFRGRVKEKPPREGSPVTNTNTRPRSRCWTSN